ncbi:acetate--CoA ligase [Haladaptatus sp. NG-SE-30]
MADGENIEPPQAFAEQANVDVDSRERFDQKWPEAWAEAAELLSWDDQYDTVFEDGQPMAWFSGGQLNASYNCVDRHLDDRKNQLALIWEGRRGERHIYTYLDLHREVNEFAAALRDLGVEEDDIVTLYLPMVPELLVAMLACVRIGAVHNIVYAGFSSDSLATRMQRTESKLLVTCDGYYRQNDAVNLKNQADNARLEIEADLQTVVVNRLGSEPHLGDESYRYDDLLAAHTGQEVEPVVRDAGDTLFRIYTSGTTGQPKAVEHTTGGYLAQVAWTTRTVLDVTPADTHWCAADASWITGHSYAVYGPLALGATTLLVEGAVDSLDQRQPWGLIERNAVDVFYTSPTAIRSFMKRGTEGPKTHDLSSVRLLGAVGEPLEPSVWRWYYEHVGRGDCPIVDTWWQTETGAILISTVPGVDEMKPGTVGPPLPGIEIEVVNESGDRVDPNEDGYLTITRPWPAMSQSLLTDGRGAATTPSDDWRYYPEDSVRVAEDGYVTVLGRTDGVINVGGRRFSTLELESTIVDVEGITEAVVVVGNHPTQGRAIHVYACCGRNHVNYDDLRRRVNEAVESIVGVTTPQEVVFTPELPKTHSGKLIRRILVAVSNDEELNDTSALRNPEVVGELLTTNHSD